jgi:hypothetical protein
MTENQLMVVPPLSITSLLSNGRIKLPEEALTQRDLLLEEASTVGDPKTESDRDHGINVSARLKGQIEMMEEARVRAKSDYYAVCCAIDITAKEYKEKLEAERARINRGNGAFEQRRLAAIRRAEEEAEAEKKRLALEAQRLEQEAAKAAQANDLAAALELEEKAQAASDKIEEIAQEQVLVEVPKPKGSTLRTNLEIKVLDIRKVYAAKPHLVDLSLNLTAAKHEINHRLAEDELIPGLSWQRVADLSARKR